MPPTVGFIVLSHNKPYQTVRLVTALNRMFDCPPIVCHHDFSQINLDVDSLTKNVSLVRPHVQTAWGSFSIVEAMLRALQLMYESPHSPDWFIFLSGADYPIKPARQIVADLDSSSFDVHIGHVPIKYHAYQSDWEKHCFNRYCVVRTTIPSLSMNKGLHLVRRKVTISHPLLTAPFLPFSSNLRCFAGEFWFCANRKAANYLVKFYNERPALAAHYRKTSNSSESYCQTVLCNAAQLRISGNNWRYVDWTIDGPHPKTLLSEDLPKLLASSAHFARKFDMDADAGIYDALDAIVGE
jgi:hypothetical protein